MTILTIICAVGFYMLDMHGSNIVEHGKGYVLTLGYRTNLTILIRRDIGYFIVERESSFRLTWISLMVGLSKVFVIFSCNR